MAKLLQYATVFFVGSLLCLTANGQSDGDLRLIGGPSRCEGRLEIFSGFFQDWGQVCNQNFDEGDARSACSDVGCSGGQVVGIDNFGQRSRILICYPSGDCICNAGDPASFIGLQCSSSAVVKASLATIIGLCLLKWLLV